METWRRGILLACVCLAIVAAKFAVLKPLIRVQPVDFAEKQKDESRWTEEGERLSGLGLDAYIAEKTKGLLVPVAGPEWERVFEDMNAVQKGSTRDAKLFRRVPSDERKFQFVGKSFFYRPSEAPLTDLAAKLQAEHDTVYIALKQGGAVSYLEATLHTFSRDDFRFGSGFSHSPKPPAAFVFPYRIYSLWILLFGLAAYIFLPRKKNTENALYYPNWRNVLGDFGSFLLIVPFFALPILIVGGSVQAITEGWILCLIFWPIGLLGVWLLRRMAWCANYLVTIEADGLILKTGKEPRKVSLTDLDHYRPLVLTAPRWLVGMSWLAALSARGNARVGATGRAMILSGSAYGGLGLSLKDGSSVYLWVEDAMGTRALKNSRKLIKMLEKAGIPLKKDPETIRSIAPPLESDRTGKVIKEGSERVIWMLAALPVLVMIIFFFIVMFGHAH